ncbi:MAG: YetF domain-containing protein [Candidatus Rokuibacteriota bacterium]
MDASMWTEMLRVGPPVLEKVLRPIIVYLFLVVALRFAGKRELAQLTPLDLVVLLMLSNTVQNAIIGEDHSLVGGMIGAVALLVVNAMMARALFAHPQLTRVVEGEPTVLIERGRVDEAALQRERMTREELEEAARRNGIAVLADVERAVLEAGGSVSLIARAQPEAMHEDLVRRLDGIARDITAIRAALGGGR